MTDDTPDTLATCWYCPECGDRTGLDTFQEHMNGHWIEAWDGHENFCPGRPVQHTMVPLDGLRSSAGLCGVLGILGLNTREGWLSKTDEEGKESIQNLLRHQPRDRIEYFVPVLVVELPSGLATKEGTDG